MFFTYIELCRIYVDGLLAASEPTSIPGYVNFNNMNHVVLSYHGEGSSKCECDIAEVEIYSRHFTDQEVFDRYARHITGVNCP